MVSLSAASELALAQASDSSTSSDGPALTSDTGFGRKFAPDGQVQRWPGCTLICHIPRPSEAFDALEDVRDLMRSSRALRHQLTWTPEQSYHMTVCDLLNEYSRRERAKWPTALPQDTPLDVARAFVGESLRQIEAAEVPPFRMVLDPQLKASPFHDGNRPRTAVPWVPRNEAEASRIDTFRRRVFSAIGIVGHEDSAYQFHTTLAYPLRALSAEDSAVYAANYVRSMKMMGDRVPVLELSAPEFCLFESMYFFERQFYIGGRRR